MSSYEAISKFSSDFSSFEFHTTSSDTFLSPEDILSKTGPIWHGTAIAWHSSFSSFTSKLPIVSTRFCGVQLKTDDLEIIAYTAYLPTSGQDEGFLEEIALLTHDLHQNISSNSTIIIGMDANTSKKSTSRRQEAFSNFKREFHLESILPGDEPTFHHNNGVSETQIDYILTNNRKLVSFLKQLCKKEDPVNLSSHDALVGKISISTNKKEDDIDFTETYEVFEPKKIIWGQNEEYKDMTIKILSQLMINLNTSQLLQKCHLK